jgi:hypothetical protein
LLKSYSKALAASKQKANCMDISPIFLFPICLGDSFTTALFGKQDKDQQITAARLPCLAPPALATSYGTSAMHRNPK